MNRQRIRRALILVSFVLFPATIFYFSPELIIIGAGEGLIVGSFVVFALQLVFALTLGRLYCGWMCPAAGLQEALAPVSDKKASNRFNWIKWIIWVPWIVTIAITAISAGGFRKVDLFYQTRYGLSVVEPGAYIIYFIVTSVIMILALAAGRRGFCHYGCWMAPFMIIGTRLGRLLKIPALHLRSDRSQCSECKRCEKVCPMSLEVAKMVQAESILHAECILCGSCADNCPHGVIRYSFGRPA
ncbi:MAG: 4Fe-4S binding protein [Planctomycetota bacterium]|jgi:polyferredoxin